MRKVYTMNLKTYMRILTHDLKPPVCEACGFILGIGSKVLSKPTSNSTYHRRGYVKRYHLTCAKKLLIWR